MSTFGLVLRPRTHNAADGDAYGLRTKQAGIEVFLPRALQKGVTFATGPQKGLAAKAGPETHMVEGQVQIYSSLLEQERTL